MAFIGYQQMSEVEAKRALLHTRRRETFALEDVAEMSTTGSTGDFNTSHAPAPVFMLIDGTRKS
jgi:hypothetical protein